MRSDPFGWPCEAGSESAKAEAPVGIAEVKKYRR
jgi:hypothetical protein